MGLAEGVYCLVRGGVDLERWVRGLRVDEREWEDLCLRPRGRPLSDTEERMEPAELQRSRGVTLKDWEDSIDDMRERGGEPSVEEGAETDLDQGVKRGFMNFEEKDLFEVGRDCWEDEEEVDGFRLTTGGRGGGGTGVGVLKIESVDRRPGISSSRPPSWGSAGSGTTGNGANLIFLQWAGLESSSGGRMETLRAGELGRDLGEL